MKPALPITNGIPVDITITHHQKQYSIMKYGILSVIALLFDCMVYTQDMEPVLEEAAKLEKNLKET